MSLDQLRTLIAEGHTVAEIANRKGVSFEEIVNIAVASIQDELREAVKNGLISDEEANGQVEAIREGFVQEMRSLLEDETPARLLAER